jgi:hypothetical protein
MTDPLEAMRNHHGTTGLTERPKTALTAGSAS